MSSSLASLVLYLHVLWIALIIVPVPVIIIGAILKWGFVRNPWFRYGHVGMMAVVLILAIVQIECPLTTLEKLFLERAGEPSYEGAFIDAWLERLIYYQAPPSVFLAIYIAFFMLIVGLLVVVKPYRQKK